MRTTTGGVLPLLLILLGTTVPARGGEHRALFVGVGHHADERLDDPAHHYAEADAQALGDLFRTAGFDVALLLGKEATTTAIKDQLDAIATMDGAEDDVIVVGFFGQGSQFDVVRERSEPAGLPVPCFAYLGSSPLRWVDTILFCTHDAHPWPALRTVPLVAGYGRAVARDEDGQQVWEPNPNTLFGFGQVIDALRRSNAGSKLLFIDCHVRAASPGVVYPWGSRLFPEDLPAGTVAMVATHHPLDRPTEDAEWQHGAFAKAILDSCSSDPVITAMELSAIVRRSVIRLAGAKLGRQAPRVIAASDVDFDLPLTGLPRPALPLPLPLPPKPADPTNHPIYGRFGAGTRPLPPDPEDNPSAPAKYGLPPAGHDRRTLSIAVPLSRHVRDLSRYEMGNPTASWSILNPSDSIPGADGKSSATAGVLGFETTRGDVHPPAPARIPNPVPSVRRGP